MKMLKQKLINEKYYYYRSSTTRARSFVTKESLNNDFRLMKLTNLLFC